MEITPTPTDEEAAVIAVALEATRRRAVAAAAAPESPRWRFSGRWWSKPIPSRRDRPS